MWVQCSNNNNEKHNNSNNNKHNNNNNNKMYGGGAAGGGNAWMKIMGIGGDQVQKRQAQKGKKDADGKPIG